MLMHQGARIIYCHLRIWGCNTNSCSFSKPYWFPIFSRLWWPLLHHQKRWWLTFFSPSRTFRFLKITDRQLFFDVWSPAYMTCGLRTCLLRAYNFHDSNYLRPEQCFQNEIVDNGPDSMLLWVTLCQRTVWLIMQHGTALLDNMNGASRVPIPMPSGW